MKPPIDQRRGPLLLVVSIVAIPLLLLVLATRYILHHEQTLAEGRLRQLMTRQLDDVNRSIERHLAEVARELREQTAIDVFETEGLRALTRREPRFLQLFVLRPDGSLQYPDPLLPLNPSESGFLLRASKMFTEQDLKAAVAQSEENEGWFVWYWDRGQNLIFWQRRPDGHIVGVALEGARWMADLIAELPESGASRSSVSEQSDSFDVGLRLVDESSSTIYQWGSTEIAASEKSFCEIPVVAPLSSWRLQCVLPTSEKRLTVGYGFQLALWTALAGTTVGLSTLAFVLHHAYAREVRKAAQQVSFVNHVSHELKTPLTNIRLYAELVERDLRDAPLVECDALRKRVRTILSESERLSRLIGNVLTFASSSVK